MTRPAALGADGEAPRKSRSTRIDYSYFSWVEENGENTLHEPATATTKPKRTTQTKETSWHTPAVIYRLERVGGGVFDPLGQKPPPP